MNLKTWKKEFYPVPGSRPKAIKKVIEHSLRMWLGLQKANLEEHNLRRREWFITSKKYSELRYRFAVDGSTNALCRRYHKDGQCGNCPFILNIGKCDEFSMRKGSLPPYGSWIKYGNPEPMIEGLRLLLEKLEAGELVEG